MEWTAEAIETLQALWAEGHSTAEIGRRMGISKNAVVGKAHRLNLPRLLAPPPAPRSAPAPRAPVAAPPVVRPFQRSGARTCCWPIGEPGTPEFRFCTAEAVSGRPYCAEHASIAYVKARDRREDAA